jgi:patatin-like phospholipase/acyl hydrolase
LRRILSIDGGGIRGIIPATLLRELERRLDRPAARLFDLIAGTSTGGILALGLTLDNGQKEPRYSAAELRDLYLKHGREIFHRSFWRGVTSVGGITDEKYPQEPLERILERYLGEAQLGEALVPVLVSCYDIAGRQPIFFKSWQPQMKGVLARQVARATAAAPTYFEPALVRVDGQPRPLIDGGVFATNPAMCAYAEARRLFPDEPLLLVSLGTGKLTRPITYEEACGWGQLEWAIPLLSIVFDGVSQTVDYQLRQILGPGFCRFQTELRTANDDMDDASPANLRALVIESERLLADQGEPFAEMCALLQADEPIA